MIVRGIREKYFRKHNALIVRERYLERYYSMKLLFICICFFPILSCALETPQDAVAIGAYNMYLFFDGTDDGWEYDGFRRSDGYTLERYQERVHDAAVFIARNIDADILILSEVESPVVLHDLLEAGLRKKGYSFYGLASDGSAPLSVGFISRIEPVSSALHSTDGERAILDLAFRTSSGSLRVFGIHARSRLEEGSEKIRMLQFRHLQALMSDADEDIVIAAGDFNADPRYPEGGMTIFPESDSIHVPLKITGDPGLSSDTIYYSPFMDGEEGIDAEGTYCYQGKWYFLDNIIMDRRAFDGIGLEYRRASVIRPFESMDILGRPLAYDTSAGRGYSDHFAVMMHLQVF